MLLDAQHIRADVSALNAGLKHHTAVEVLRTAFVRTPNLALVSSFGAESVALLHLVAQIKPDVQVLFIDTQLLFPETLAYQAEVARDLGLRNVEILRADPSAEDPTDDLHRRDPDACCALRKTAPLDQALSGFDGWITGRKRYQSGQRADLPHLEVEEGSGRIKVNPLAHWQATDVRDYMTAHDLPRHPLVAQGYPSIGCAPCTTPVAPGEDPRAGRWRSQTKDECGIHFVNGKAVPQGATR